MEKTILLDLTLILIGIGIIMNNWLPSYAKTEEPYHFAFKWGSLGTGHGQFVRPHDIEFDSVGNVYVSDRDLNNIQQFAHRGEYLAQWGKTGLGDGEFRTPYSISIDPKDNIYVVDRDNNRIQKFSNNGDFPQEMEFYWNWPRWQFQ